MTLAEHARRNITNLIALLQATEAKLRALGYKRVHAAARKDAPVDRLYQGMLDFKPWEKALHLVPAPLHAALPGMQKETGRHFLVRVLE